MFCFKTLKDNSHQAQEKAKAKKIKEPPEKIREKAAIINGNFRVRFHFRLVWIEPYTTGISVLC